MKKNLTHKYATYCLEKIALSLELKNHERAQVFFKFLT